MDPFHDKSIQVRNTESPSGESQLVSPSFSPVSVTNVNSTEHLDNLHSCRTQVCDRCRKLKKKCYGTGPVCNNCLISNNECTITKTLKRRRKPKPTKLNPIEIENIKLKLRVQELENATLEHANSKMLCSGERSMVKLEDMHYHSLSSSSQANSMENSAMHSPISNDEPLTILTSNSGCNSSTNSPNQGSNSRAGGSLHGVSKKRPIKNIICSDFKYIVKTRSLKFDLAMMGSMSKILLPNEDNYNGSAIIEEYSIVDNFLQQDFVKILREQKSKINYYMDRFFTEINILFPVILEKDYMLMKTDELMKSIDVTNFNTNVINDEHNLCIVYKVILISMFYIKDLKVRNGYLKTVKHLLSRFEFLDPVNTLKCYLLTHLFAQMSNNKPLLVRMNGLMSSLAMNLRINKFKECNELKRELWYICYCYDFFANDQNNLDYSLTRYLNDVELSDELEKELQSEGLESCDSMRMIHDHSVLKNMGDSKFILQVIKVKRSVYNNEVSISSAIKQMLSLSELRKMCHLDRHLNDENEELAEIPDEEYQCHFHVSFSLLYYMDALIFLQNSHVKSLRSKSSNSNISNNTNYKKQVKLLYSFIETMLKIWLINIQTYDYIPLINVNKLFQYGIFIHWYASNYISDDENRKAAATTDTVFQKDIRENSFKALNMVIDLLNRHKFLDENLKNCRDILMGLLVEIPITKEKRSYTCSDAVPHYDQSNPSKKTKSQEVNPSIPNDIEKFKKELDVLQTVANKDSKSYQLISSPFAKVDVGNDVENQLNNYVSGFTFDTNSDTFAGSPVSLHNVNTNNDNNRSENRHSKSNVGELFNNISDTVDLKKINLNANDFYEIKFE